ncbi:MAG: hypothetical protein GY804_12790 [Alphaproteobacteria bacterium]|nr:hypothetical protein [Alphaproteobacteria bacterium]
MTIFKSLLFVAILTIIANIPLTAHASEVGDRSTAIDKISQSFEYKNMVRTGAVAGEAY